jgi:hypothetical protein
MENNKKKARVPRVEFRRIANNRRQIQVLTYQPGEDQPFETIADIVPLRKRAPAKRPAATGA